MRETFMADLDSPNAVAEGMVKVLQLLFSVECRYANRSPVGPKTV